MTHTARWRKSFLQNYNGLGWKATLLLRSLPTWEKAARIGRKRWLCQLVNSRKCHCHFGSSSGLPIDPEADKCADNICAEGASAFGGQYRMIDDEVGAMRMAIVRLGGADAWKLGVLRMIGDAFVARGLSIEEWQLRLKPNRQSAIDNILCILTASWLKTGIESGDEQGCGVKLLIGDFRRRMFRLNCQLTIGNS